MGINEFTEMSGISKETISKIENREMIPSIEAIAKLSLAMKLELNDLIDIHKFCCKNNVKNSGA